MPAICMDSRHPTNVSKVLPALGGRTSVTLGKPSRSPHIHPSPINPNRNTIIAVQHDRDFPGVPDSLVRSPTGCARSENPGLSAHCEIGTDLTDGAIVAKSRGKGNASPKSQQEAGNGRVPSGPSGSERLELGFDACQQVAGPGLDRSIELLTVSF